LGCPVAAAARRDADVVPDDLVRCGGQAGKGGGAPHDHGGVPRGGGQVVVAVPVLQPRVGAVRADRVGQRGGGTVDGQELPPLHGRAVVGVLGDARSGLGGEVVQVERLAGEPVEERDRPVGVLPDL